MRKCNKEFETAEGLAMHEKQKHNKEKKHILSLQNKKKIRNWSIAIILIGLIVGLPLYMGISKTENATVEISNDGTAISLLGSKAPDFTLPSTTGENIALSDYTGKKNVLLYFQEGVMCDPCWQQTLDIQKEYDKFQAQDIELITITVDPFNAITKNAERFGLTLPVLEDEDLQVSKLYDVLTDSMHPGERPGHTFVLVDKSGNVIWKKAYFLASGSTKMEMHGQVMDMGMDMGKPGSVMYVPVDKLLEDLKSVNLAPVSSTDSIEDDHHSTSTDMNMPGSNMTTQDHSMCLTPIHYHNDFKMYLGETMLNFTQNNYMEQSNIVHFHKTAKVKPDDVAGLPNGLMIHVHKEDIPIRDFFKTLDLPFNVDDMQGLKVYVNGVIQPSGLNYVLKDKERILVTDSNDETQIKSQIDSVTDYTVQGKEKNPSLFGGC